MLKEIEQGRKSLNELIDTHSLSDKIVLEASQRLDKLISGYYFKDKKEQKRINTKKFISIRSMG